jgi:hypothetical protein
LSLLHALADAAVNDTTKRTANKTASTFFTLPNVTINVHSPFVKNNDFSIHLPSADALGILPTGQPDLFLEDSGIW